MKVMLSMFGLFCLLMPASLMALNMGYIGTSNYLLGVAIVDLVILLVFICWFDYQ